MQRSRSPSPHNSNNNRRIHQASYNCNSKNNNRCAARSNNFREESHQDRSSRGRSRSRSPHRCNDNRRIHQTSYNCYPSLSISHHHSSHSSSHRNGISNSTSHIESHHNRQACQSGYQSQRRSNSSSSSSSSSFGQEERYSRHRRNNTCSHGFEAEGYFIGENGLPTRHPSLSPLRSPWDMEPNRPPSPGTVHAAGSCALSWKFWRRKNDNKRIKVTSEGVAMAKWRLEKAKQERDSPN